MHIYLTVASLGLLALFIGCGGSDDEILGDTWLGRWELSPQSGSVVKDECSCASVVLAGLPPLYIARTEQGALEASLCANMRCIGVNGRWTLIASNASDFEILDSQGPINGIMCDGEHAVGLSVNANLSSETEGQAFVNFKIEHEESATLKGCSMEINAILIRTEEY